MGCRVDGLPWQALVWLLSWTHVNCIFALTTRARSLQLCTLDVPLCSVQFEINHWEVPFPPALQSRSRIQTCVVNNRGWFSAVVSDTTTSIGRHLSRGSRDCRQVLLILECFTYRPATSSAFYANVIYVQQGLRTVVVLCKRICSYCMDNEHIRGRERGRERGGATAATSLLSWR